MQRFPNSRGQVAAIEIPLASHGALGDGSGNTAGFRSTQSYHFCIGELTRANLDAVHPHRAAFVLIPIAEQNRRGLQGPSCIIQALVGGPVVLLDTVHVFGHHRRVGRLVICCNHPMPDLRGEGAGAIVATTTLAEVVALPEQVPIVRVIQRGADIQQGSRACARVIDHHVHDQGVLVDLRAASVGSDAMGHDITQVAAPRSGVTRHLHYIGDLTVDVRNAEGGSGAEGRLGWIAARATIVVCRIQILQRVADRGRQVTKVKVPLAGDLSAGAARNVDGERPGVGVQTCPGVGVNQADIIVGRGPVTVRAVFDGGLVANLREGLGNDRCAVD